MPYHQAAAPLAQASVEMQQPGHHTGLEQTSCVAAVQCWGQWALSEAGGLKRTMLRLLVGLLGPAKPEQCAGWPLFDSIHSHIIHKLILDHFVPAFDQNSHTCVTQYLTDASSFCSLNFGGSLTLFCIHATPCWMWCCFFSRHWHNPTWIAYFTLPSSPDQISTAG